MKIIKYPDGSSYVNGIGIGLHNSVVRINTYEDLWHLNQAVDAYYNYFGTFPTITIPNLIDAQADRRFNKDESHGLKLVCNFLGNMKAKFKIFHPHNPEVVEALMDNVEIIDNSRFIHKVLNELYVFREEDLSGNDNWTMSDSFINNTILMSSDAGGFKPLMKLCDKIGWEGLTESASKSRKEGKVDEQKLPLEDFQGKDVLIIDDISIYGGTFKGLSKLLRERNVGKLYLAVSHMTVQNLGEDPVTNYFDKVFTTNSKFEEYITDLNSGHDRLYGEIPNNIEVIKMF